ncbi:MAG: DUF4428 domain-containing protein [Clostridiales bacterium]|nr:DUF4428 domain-containing protein [Clostridiales bacterium]MCD8110417.1 DUF4428 domain-containing protein [Clostridiales bacterium]
MGLFTKKDVCPVCGKKIKGDVLVKIRDNVALCQSCSAMINMDTVLIPNQTVEDIKEHLNYREKNMDKFIRFEPTQEVKAGATVLYVDEPAKLWYCTRNKKEKNPPIFAYGELSGMQYLEDGQPVENEEKTGLLGSLFGDKSEAKTIRSMKIRIDLDNPYTKTVDIEMIAPNSELKTGSITYKSNRRTLEKVKEILSGILANQQDAGLYGEVAAASDTQAENIEAPDAAAEKNAGSAMTEE